MRYNRRRRPFYSTHESMNVFVLGGLPLTAEFIIEPADESVGYTGGIADVTLHDRRGKRAEWAEVQMKPKDWDNLATYIAEYFEPEEPDYDRD